MNTPKIEKIVLDIPDNSRWTKEFRSQHPVLYKFIKKYETQKNTIYSRLRGEC